MKKLKDIGNYHFGIGIITIGVQLIFQISFWLILLGIGILIISFYEKRIWNQLKKISNQNQSHKIWSTYKWISGISIFVFFGMILMMINDSFLAGEWSSWILKGNFLVVINSMILSIVATIFFQNKAIDKMRSTQ